MNNSLKPKQGQPPRLADKLLEWFCAPHLLEELQGDLHEEFYYQVGRVGLQRARYRYYWDVLGFIRPFAIKHKSNTYSSTSLLSISMLENYFKIAWRNLFKHKLYSSIKIGGFALGIAACILIALFIRDELSYDTSYPNADRIYRVIGVYNDRGEILRGVHFQAPFAKVLKETFPEVEQTARLNASPLFGAGSKQLRRADEIENAYEEGFTFADQEILDILQIPMVYGDRAHALDEPNTLVITKRKADKYFPNENPVGKLMILNNEVKNPYKIGGVMEDLPATSHLPYDFFMTLKGVEFYPGEQTNWMSNNYPTYLLLRPGANTRALEKKLAIITEKYLVPSMKEAGNIDAVDMTQKLNYQLQPVRDIHLKSFGIRDRLSHGDIRFVWLFGTVAAFILIIACINFINLSTAKSANRAKEVGIRKVVGSVRIHLIKQFLTESMLFSFLSFALGLLLAWLLLPFFNTLAAKTLSFPFEQWWFLPILIGAALIIGILAGIYPSFYLSAFKPIDVLKGKVSGGSKSATLRSVLVIFQFTASIILIAGTFIIYRQMGYILNKKVGFDKEQVVLIQGANTLGEGIKSLKNELLHLPDVKHVSISDYLPIKGTKRNQNQFWKEGRSKEDKPVGSQIWHVDHDYLKTLGMKLVEGRDFSPGMASDSQAVIINQTMGKELGLKDPIGQRITNGNVFTVIGVVEDFHFESMKDSIQPIVLALGNSPSMVSVKVNTTDMSSVLPSINRVWKEFAPNQPIRYSFLDESFATMYADIERMGRIFSTFAILAIIVACLGLYGLSSFMVEQRSKEIGIRLVLGASVKNIFSLLTLNFVKLILLSIAIAVPIAWYMMQKWLEEFVYRTQISVDVFLIAGLAALLIALLTISYQAIRAALMNPVKNLRSE